MKAHVVLVAALVFYSVFVPPSDAASFICIDLGLLASLAYDFVPKRDLAVMWCGAAVIIVLALRVLTDEYLVLPHHVLFALTRGR
jgi:hypothetical protein